MQELIPTLEAMREECARGSNRLELNRLIDRAQNPRPFPDKPEALIHEAERILASDRLYRHREYTPGTEPLTAKELALGLVGLTLGAGFPGPNG